MSGRLDGQHVALLIEQGFELREVNEPRQTLQQEGAEVVLIGSTARTPYQDKVGTTTIVSDLGAGAIKMKDFQALVIPGGHAPDRMRMRHAMVDLATDAMASGKLVAAICHGPQVLISANALRGRTLTCWPSIAIDVKNAGGLYVDRPVVRDGNLITSRKADDLPVFIETLIEALSLRPA